MLSYITIGANNLQHSGRFYTAILTPLGYEKTETAHGIEFTAPPRPGRVTTPAAIYVKQPFDGQPATPSNGAMNAFQAETQAMVRTLHTAGLTAGGTNEGPPGFRPEYSPQFYVAYLRDPVGNKLAIFSANPTEPTRNP